MRRNSIKIKLNLSKIELFENILLLFSVWEKNLQGIFYI